MLRNKLKSKQGFTLIEIVLVMAIAALILVIIFLALQGAQRSRRDQQRRTDNARVLAQFEQYAASNSGNYPASGNWTSGNFQATYITPMGLKDPQTGGAYNFVAGTRPTCPGAGVGAIGFDVVGRFVFVRMCLEQGQADLSNQ